MTDPVTVDARGMRCPWPALRLARAMRGAAAALLLSDDPRAEAEAAALAAQHGWTLMVERDGPIWHINAAATS
ncbi:MAG: sulfurtransferase TusA family protein [Sphingopyxis sp.]|nr:sulfurtransferase TusA family protein [Sphingopyxis sp.]